MSSSNIKWPRTIMILNIWQSEKKRNLWTFKSWTVHRTLQWISSSVVLPLDCTRVDLHSSQFQMIPFILDWTFAQPLNSSRVWIKPSKLAVPHKKTWNLLFRAIWSLGFWITGIISMLLMFFMSIHHLNCRHITGESRKTGWAVSELPHCDIHSWKHEIWERMSVSTPGFTEH